MQSKIGLNVRWVGDIKGGSRLRKRADVGKELMGRKSEILN